MAALSDFADLVFKFQLILGFDTLVETGTYLGESTHWAAWHFHRVVTIEKDRRYQEQAELVCKEFTNIEFILGDSRSSLPSVVAKLTNPSLFWLDAHNESNIFQDGPNDCPLLAELSALMISPLDHVALIDDAHCFSDSVAGFPSVPEIAELLRIKNYALRHAKDLFIALPAQHARFVNNIDWK